ncbi:MAG: sigma-70 family RNA polymerase sigma factor [Burkholderiaceae bacterium]|nr:sigma-70 family RNA polymerase sigma factor [Burkholderiaceae bacterium]
MNDSDPAKQPDTAQDGDAVLLQRIAAGDRLAFEAFYRAYVPRLGRFLHRLVRRSHVIEEVLNDAMLVVWRSAAKFRGQSKVSTWVFAIAYNKALKAIQRIDDPVDSDPEMLESEQLEPEGYLMQEQRTALLWGIVDRMSAEHRAVIELTYYHGYSYDEIAEIMGCPINTVKTRMYHARRRLQTMVSERMEDFR